MQRINLLEGKIPHVKEITFPDGQPHFELDEPWNFPFDQEVEITTRLASAQDLLRYLYFWDFITRNGVKFVLLNVTYMMGARMDRRINASESPIRILSGLLDESYDSMSIFDPHSEVCTSMFDADILTNEFLVREHIKYFGLTIQNPAALVSQHSDVILVSPDAGAAKKTFELGKKMKIPVYQASKKRDVNTGALSGFDVEEFPGGFVVLIVDDICDGGGTFSGLAEVLKKKALNRPPEEIHLIVSHGIFSKGMEIPGIDKITTTDSFRDLNVSPMAKNFYQVKLTPERFREAQ